MKITVYEKLSSVQFKGPGFDVIRLVAASTVLIHHCQAVSQSDVRLDWLHWLSRGYTHFGFLAVAIFFALSGFLVSPGLVRGGVIDFAARRVARIFPALISLTLVTMFLIGPMITSLPLSVYFASPGLYLYAKNITTLLSNYLPGVTSPDGALKVVNSALWTLHFEVLCYLAMAAASVAGLLTKRRGFLALFLITYALVLTGIVSGLPDRLATFVNLFVYFAGGAVLFLYSDVIPFSPAAALGLLAVAVAGLPMGLGALILPLAVPYCTITAGLCRLPGSLFVTRDISYGIYLIHSPVLVTLIAFVPGMHSASLTSVIVMGATAMLALLSWEFVEKPALKRKKILAAAIHAALHFGLPPKLPAFRRSANKA